ncbi:hypothetical protein [Reinekea sp.]|nr:hypothetical protein [Reinekea sp.]
MERTDSLLQENVDASMATVNALREVAAQVSLGDVGTGYSP